jgi:transcription-repair coupling factor (superfamily II helicase)
MYRADKFGLAQLHQLRGRVGRSHHQAYAYLLTPDKNSLSANAVKRLDAIKSMEELGSGFFLALHDLEIRGAGEVLGEQQSGNISEIGFSLYTEMLETAIKTMKQNNNNDILDIPLKSPIEVNLHVPALLPKNYCPDVNERLTIYKRLADTKNIPELTLVEDELIDRFGSIPNETKALFMTHEFRQKASKLGVKKIDVIQDSITINFDETPNIDISNMVDLIKSDRRFKLLGPNRIRFEIKNKNLSDYSINMDKFIELITIK